MEGQNSHQPLRMTYMVKHASTYITQHILDLQCLSDDAQKTTVDTSVEARCKPLFLAWCLAFGPVGLHRPGLATQLWWWSASFLAPRWGCGCLISRPGPGLSDMRSRKASARHPPVGQA